MDTQTTANSPISIVALGLAFSAALVILFVICMVSSFLYPEMPASNGWAAWMALFSVTPIEHPIKSIRVWIDGIAFCLVFGWVTAIVLGLVYNRLIHR
jgi:heme/copper-type cytochrome/quinol oxidase subunit 1